MRSTLAEIASHLRTTRTADWRWWELTEYLSRPMHVRMLFLATATIAWMTPYASILYYTSVTTGAHLSELAVTLGMLLMGMRLIAHGVSPESSPRAWVFNLRDRWTHVVLGLAIGLLAGTFTVFTTAVSTGHGPHLLPGTAIGAAYFLAFLGSTGPRVDMGPRGRATMSPAFSFAGDRRRTLIEWLWKAACIGILLGILTVADHTSDQMMFLIPGALFLALRSVDRSAWLWFHVDALTRARSLGPPWRLMRTLDDCHKLGLLRTVGPVYQFRHAELADHLARPPA